MNRGSNLTSGDRTEQTVETLYLLGKQDRIVGISMSCARRRLAVRSRV